MLSDTLAIRRSGVVSRRVTKNAAISASTATITTPVRIRRSERAMARSREARLKPTSTAPARPLAAFAAPAPGSRNTPRLPVSARCSIGTITAR